MEWFGGGEAGELKWERMASLDEGQRVEEEEGTDQDETESEVTA